MTGTHGILMSGLVCTFTYIQHLGMCIDLLGLYSETLDQKQGQGQLENSAFER